MAREVGVSNLTLFPLMTDVAGQDVAYGEPFKLPWAVNIETEDEYAEGEYYADNIVERSSKQLTKSNVTIEVSSNTPPALDAKLTGKTHAKARTVANTSQTFPRFAVAYEIQLDDGTIRKRVMYNVSLARTSHSNATMADSMEGMTYTYEGVATPLVSTKDIHLIMDEKEVNEYVADSSTNTDHAEVQADWDDFFTSVAMPR